MEELDETRTCSVRKEGGRREGGREGEREGGREGATEELN